MEIAGSLELRRLGQPRWWWHTVAGVLAIVLGAILLFGNPARGILALLWAVGVRHRQRDSAHHRGRHRAREVSALYRGTEEQDIRPTT